MTFRNRVGEGVLNPCQVSIAVATWGGSLKLKENPKCWTFTRTGIGGKIVLWSGGFPLTSCRVYRTGSEGICLEWDTDGKEKRNYLPAASKKKQNKSRFWL